MAANKKRDRTGGGDSTDDRPTYWIPSASVELVALAFYMSEFVDPGFTVNPGPHWEQKNNYGYYIKARRGLDEEDIAAIKADSRDWLKEKEWRKADNRRKLGAKRVKAAQGDTRYQQQPGDRLVVGGNNAPVSRQDDPKRHNLPYTPPYSGPQSYTASPQAFAYSSSLSDPSLAAPKKPEGGSYDDDHYNRMIIEDAPQHPSTTGTRGFSTQYVTAGPQHDTKARDSRASESRDRQYSYDYDYNRQ